MQRLVLITVAVAVLTTAAPALAQDPVIRDAYGGAGNVAGKVVTNAGTGTGTAPSGIAGGGVAGVNTESTQSQPGAGPVASDNPRGGVAGEVVTSAGTGTSTPPSGNPRGGVAGVNAESTQSQPGAGPAAASAAATSPLRGAELPFTGLDLGLIVGVGILLLALGFGVRRVSRESAT